MNTFKPFGMTHILTIFLIVVVCIGFVIYLEKNGSQQSQGLTHIFVVLLTFSILLHYIWAGGTRRLTFAKDLPFTLCYVSAILCIVELLIKKKLLFEILFYVTIFAGIRAIICPDLYHTFPHIKYLQFFMLHLLMLLSIIYMSHSYGYTLNVVSVIKSWLALLIYALCIFIYNIITGANYLYLAHKPVFKTELEYLGEWPFYFISVSVLMLAVFYVIHFVSIAAKRIVNSIL